MVEQVLKDLESKIKKSVGILREEMGKIHTGRASVSLVDSIEVDAYGTKNPLKAIASITVPEANSIVIQPWDKANLNQIEVALRESDLSVNPVNTGENIRVNFPELTQERREEYVKLAKKKAEEAKISIRNHRTESINTLKKAENGGEIGEDERFRGEEEIQKVVDRYNDTVDSIFSEKEKELKNI